MLESGSKRRFKTSFQNVIFCPTVSPSHRLAVSPSHRLAVPPSRRPTVPPAR
jgi:hypothetical protein